MVADEFTHPKSERRRLFFFFFFWRPGRAETREDRWGPRDDTAQISPLSLDDCD
jgi:hypothetical protein